MFLIKSGEPKEEIKKEVVEEIPISEQDGSKPKEVSYFGKVEQSEEIVAAKITVGGEELITKLNEEKEEVESPVYEGDGKDEGEIEEVEEVSRPVGIRGLDKEVAKRLSTRDLRWFQRTGKLPK